MELEVAPVDRVRPLGRGPKVRAAVLAATLAELTEGESRRANVALLVNNARVGGQIARELQAIQA